MHALVTKGEADERMDTDGPCDTPNALFLVAKIIMETATRSLALSSPRRCCRNPFRRGPRSFSAGKGSCHPPSHLQNATAIRARECAPDVVTRPCRLPSSSPGLAIQDVAVGLLEGLVLLSTSPGHSHARCAQFGTILPFSQNKHPLMPSWPFPSSG